MATTTRAGEIIEALGAAPKMGEIKKHAKAIKTDHDLALELWATGGYYPRMLAALIFDKARLDAGVLEDLAGDLEAHPADERNRVSEWLLANQLMKRKPLVALLEGWRDHPSPVLRRLHWYHQARLRWTGKIPPPGDSAAVLAAIEAGLATEHPDVQWVMNFCAGWIGVYEPALRARCVALGEELGLYAEEKAPKGCTPNYLPEFIRIEVAKRA